MFRFLLRRAALPAFLLLLLPSLFLHATPDYETSENHVFTITTGHNDTALVYNLTSEHTVRATYLTPQSLTRRIFNIGESFFNPIGPIRTSLNDAYNNRITIEHNVEQQRDILTSDYRMYTVTFPAVLKPGDVAEYTYERTYRGIEYFPLLQIYNMDSVSSWSVRISHPANLHIDFDIWFARDSLPYTISRARAGETVLTFSPISRAKPLRVFAFNSIHAYVQVVPRTSTRIVVPSEPRAFAAWYRSLFDQTPAIDTAIPQHLRTRIAALPDNRARLAALHDYVRTTIRYIAEEHDMGAIVPRDPATVLQRSFGDCKDRAFLICNLARAFGIDNVYMALINTEARPALRGCHIWQYNHAICALEENGQVLFFDPTDTYTAFGIVPERLIERPAFVLNPDNPRHVVVTDIGTPPPIVDIAVTASTDAPQNARARVVLRGYTLAQALWMLDNYHGDRLSSALSELIAEHVHSIGFGNVALVQRGDTAAEFTADADLSRFLVAAPARMYIPSTPFPRVRDYLIDRREDTCSVSFEARDNLALRISLAAPGYSAAPASVSLGEGTPGSFTATVTPTAGGVDLYYHFLERRREFGGDDKRRHMQFCAAYLQQKKQMFTLTGGTR